MSAIEQRVRALMRKAYSAGLGGECPSCRFPKQRTLLALELDEPCPERLPECSHCGRPTPAS